MIIRGTIKRYPDGQESLALHERQSSGAWEIICVGSSDLCAQDLPQKARRKYIDARHVCTTKKPTAFYYCNF